MEPKNRKKIHFSVPVTHGHLDPKAVQMIRRRRPTPAALFRASDHSSPEEELSPHQRSPSADNGALKPKQVASPCPYRPPSVKAVQRIAQCYPEAESQDLLSDAAHSDVAESDSWIDSNLSDSSDMDVQFPLSLHTGKEQLTARKPRPKYSQGAIAKFGAETGAAGPAQREDLTQPEQRTLQQRTMSIKGQPPADGRETASQQTPAKDEGDPVFEDRGRSLINQQDCEEP